MKLVMEVKVNGASPLLTAITSNTYCSCVPRTVSAAVRETGLSGDVSYNNPSTHSDLHMMFACNLIFLSKYE